jgi:hypothetical protein
MLPRSLPAFAVLSAASAARAATAAHEAAASAAESLVVVPQHIAWARVLTLGIMWLFLAAIFVGLLVTWIAPSEAPRPAADHDHDHDHDHAAHH